MARLKTEARACPERHDMERCATRRSRPCLKAADLSAYAGREQAYVKRYLLEKYLAPLAYKVGSAWDSFVYIDGFSGPWQTTRPDYAGSSIWCCRRHVAPR